MDYLFFDWAAMATTFLAVYMLGNHNRWGFVVLMVSNACWITVGTLAGSHAMMWGNAVFLIVNLRGWIKWKRGFSGNDPAAGKAHT